MSTCPLPDHRTLITCGPTLLPKIIHPVTSRLLGPEFRCPASEGRGGRSWVGTGPRTRGVLPRVREVGPLDLNPSSREEGPGSLESCLGSCVVRLLVRFRTGR